MVTHRVPIPDGGDDVERPLSCDIHRFIPPRVQVAINDPRLCQPLLILIAQYHVWITEPIHVASFEIFCLDNFDREDICAHFSLPLCHGWRMSLNYLGAAIRIDLFLKAVKLRGGKVHIIQLDERLEIVSECQIAKTKLPYLRIELKWLDLLLIAPRIFCHCQPLLLGTLILGSLLLRRQPIHLLIEFLFQKVTISRDT